MSLFPHPLPESERLFRQLADTTPVLVWFSGPDKLCDYFNKQWLGFTGRTMEQELGTGWVEGVHPDDVERCVATYIAAFDAREPFHMEYRLRRHDGEYRWMLDNAIPRHAPDGTFQGYIGTCTDITQQKAVELSVRRLNEELERRVADRTAKLKASADSEAQRAQELSEMIDTLEAFTYVVSHDLKEPVRALEVFLEDAADSQVDQAHRDKALKRAQDAAAHLRHLVHGLLEFGRATTGTLYTEPVQVDDVIASHDCRSRFEQLQHERGAKLDVSPGIPPVLASQASLAQILGNLILNSYRHNENGQPRVEIKHDHTENGHVRLHIDDNGPGFPDTVLQRFNGLQGTRPATIRGGFGLTIARRAVERLRGKMHLENLPAGARVTLELPAATLK